MVRFPASLSKPLRILCHLFGLAIVVRQHVSANMAEEYALLKKSVKERLSARLTTEMDATQLNGKFSSDGFNCCITEARLEAPSIQKVHISSDFAQKEPYGIETSTRFLFNAKMFATFGFSKYKNCKPDDPVLKGYSVQVENLPVKISGTTTLDKATGSLVWDQTEARGTVFDMGDVLGLFYRKKVTIEEPKDCLKADSNLTVGETFDKMTYALVQLLHNYAPTILYHCHTGTWSDAVKTIKGPVNASNNEKIRDFALDAIQLVIKKAVADAYSEVLRTKQWIWGEKPPTAIDSSSLSKLMTDNLNKKPYKFPDFTSPRYDDGLTRCSCESVVNFNKMMVNGVQDTENGVVADIQVSKVDFACRATESSDGERIDIALLSAKVRLKPVADDTKRKGGFPFSCHVIKKESNSETAAVDSTHKALVSMTKTLNQQLAKYACRFALEMCAVSFANFPKFRKTAFYSVGIK